MTGLTETQKSKVLKAALPRMREFSLEVWTPNNCFHSSLVVNYIANDLLRLENPLTVMPCCVFVANPRLTERTEIEGLPITTAAAEPDCYTIGIGQSTGTLKNAPGQTGAPYHVVSLNTDFLVDLSIGQVNRPDYDIQIDPVLMGKDEFERMEFPRIFRVSDRRSDFPPFGAVMNRCRVIYAPINHSVLQGDFDAEQISDTPHFQYVVGRSLLHVCDLIEAEAGLAPDQELLKAQAALIVDAVEIRVLSSSAKRRNSRK